MTIVNMQEEQHKDVSDNMLEYFMLAEFYEQLEKDENILLAGQHLRLTKLLSSSNCKKDSINYTNLPTLFVLTKDCQNIVIDENKLLSYEKYLICKLS